MSPLRHAILVQLHRLHPHALSEKQLRIALLSAGFLLQKEELAEAISALIQAEQLECYGESDGPVRYRLSDRPWDGTFLFPEILEVAPHGYE